MHVPVSLSPLSVQDVHTLPQQPDLDAHIGLLHASYMTKLPSGWMVMDARPNPLPFVPLLHRATLLLS